MWSSTPNLITLARLLFVPVLTALLYLDGDWARWAALVLFSTACLTDYVDGWLARRWDQKSAFGRWLDPVADKLLVVTVLVLLVGFARAPLLPVVVIILRELLVSGLREYMAEAHVGLPVSRLAKWKTTAQMIAICFLLVGDAAPGWLFAIEVGYTGLWLAALLTLMTGWSYLKVAVRHMVGAPEPESSSLAARRPTHPALTPDLS